MSKLRENKHFRNISMVDAETVSSLNTKVAIGFMKSSAIDNGMLGISSIISLT
jgi:hypothetical protein